MTAALNRNVLHDNDEPNHEPPLSRATTLDPPLVTIADFSRRTSFSAPVPGTTNAAGVQVTELFGELEVEANAGNRDQGEVTGPTDINRGATAAATVTSAAAMMRSMPKDLMRFCLSGENLCLDPERSWLS